MITLKRAIKKRSKELTPKRNQRRLGVQITLQGALEKKESNVKLMNNLKTYFFVFWMYQ